MILGISELQKLVKEKKLVENLSDREVETPEGAGYDLRIGEIYELTSEGFLGKTHRNTSDVKLLAKFEEDKEKSFVFQKGKYYLGKTIESLNLPDDLVGILKPRTTLFRCGLSLQLAQVSPGYCGQLTFGIANVSDQDAKVDLGSRVIHILFFKVFGETKLYKGQWQGGRVATEEMEKQI